MTNEIKRAGAASRVIRLAVAAAVGGLLLGGQSVVAQEKTLRIGMTAADIPRTLGQPDQGFEGISRKPTRPAC